MTVPLERQKAWKAYRGSVESGKSYAGPHKVMKDCDVHVTARLPLETWQKEISNSQRRLHPIPITWHLPVVWMPFQGLTNTIMGFPGGSAGKESACSAGDLGSILVLGRSPGGGHGNSSILAWRITWTEQPGGLQSTGSHEESDMTERLSTTSGVQCCNGCSLDSITHQRAYELSGWRENPI